MVSKLTKVSYISINSSSQISTTSTQEVTEEVTVVATVEATTITTVETTVDADGAEDTGAVVAGATFTVTITMEVIRVACSTVVCLILTWCLHRTQSSR